MTAFLYPNFLRDPAEYAAAEAFWQKQWHDLLRRAGNESQWQSPWINTALANGTPLRDGNPIFSANSAQRRLGIRVIQLEPADDSKELSFWTGTFAQGQPEAVKELVISCVLTPETAAEALDLMRQWITRGEIDPSRNGPVFPAMLEKSVQEPSSSELKD